MTTDNQGFYEEDERVEDVRAAWERGEHMLTRSIDEGTGVKVVASSITIENSTVGPQEIVIGAGKSLKVS